MTKLKTVLKAAAIAFVAAGGTLTAYDAIKDAALLHEYSVGECVRDFRKLEHMGNQDHFLVLYQTGEDLPDGITWDDTGMMLKCACADNVCHLAPSQTSVCRYEYTYSPRPIVDGWRVLDVFAHRKIGLGWKKAAEQTAGLKWLGGFGEARAKCLAHTTAAKCKELFDVDNHNYVWGTCDPDEGLIENDPPDKCILGNHVPSGEPCAYNYDNTMFEYPTMSYRGASDWRVSACRTWTDAEMDEL